MLKYLLLMLLATVGHVHAMNATKILGKPIVIATPSDGNTVVYNGTTQKWEFGTSGSSGAATSLNNLASTAVNASVIPGTGSLINLGSASKRWDQTWTNSVNGGNALVDLNSGLSVPSGVGSVSGMYASVATAVFTLSSAANDANATASLYFETGNKTAGTGSSGSMNFTTGTSVGGVRGKFIFTGTALRPPGGTADPSPAIEGDMYMNTSTHKLRVYNGSIWTDCN